MIDPDGFKYVSMALHAVVHALLAPSICVWLICTKAWSTGVCQDFEEEGAIMTKEDAKCQIFSRAAPKFGWPEATRLINDIIINSWAWPNLLIAYFATKDN